MKQKSNKNPHRKEVPPIKKYIGQFRVFHQSDLKHRPSNNKEDTYLLHKNGHIFRHDDNTLALFLNSSNSKNKYLPLLDESKIKYEEFLSGESEYIILFPEKQINLVAKIVNVQRKFKNEYPNYEDEKVIHNLKQQ